MSFPAAPRVVSSSPAAWASSWVDVIAHAVAHGLDPVYADDGFDFLCDRGADLPWNRPDFEVVWALVLADPRVAELRPAFLARFGVDAFESDPAD